MTNTRTATWNAIGTDVSACRNIDEVLAAAKLDYEVKSEAMTTASGIIVPNRVATVANYEDGTQRYLGVVSDNYEICQNRTAFEFVDEIHEDLQFVKAGETRTGMIYVIGKLPSIDILGDEVTPHVILQNGHNGRYQLRSTIIPLRIVCQNQFNTAFRESPNTINIIHSSQLESRIVAAKNLLSGAAEYMQEFKANAEFLAGVKCSREACIKIINDYFMKDVKTEDMSVAQMEKVQSKIASLKNAFLTDDNMNFQDNVLGLYNAFADFNTHKDIGSTKKHADSTFLTVTFDPNALAQFTAFALERAAA